MKNQGVRVITVNRARGTYYLNLEIEMPVEEVLKTAPQPWHLRLNHLAEDLVLRMIDYTAIRGFELASKVTRDCAD